MHALLWTDFRLLLQHGGFSFPEQFLFRLAFIVHWCMIYTKSLLQLILSSTFVQHTECRWWYGTNSLPGLSLGLWFFRPWSKWHKYEMWKRSKFHGIFQGQGSSVKSSAAHSGFGNETSIPKATLGTSTTAPYRITLTANLGDWNWCCRFAALASFSTFSSFASSFPAFSSAHLSLM